jgi:hypothetical protein
VPAHKLSAASSQPLGSKAKRRASLFLYQLIHIVTVNGSGSSGVSARVRVVSNWRGGHNAAPKPACMNKELHSNLHARRHLSISDLPMNDRRDDDYYSSLHDMKRCSIFYDKPTNQQKRNYSLRALLCMLNFERKRKHTKTVFIQFEQILVLHPRPSPTDCTLQYIYINSFDPSRRLIHSFPHIHNQTSQQYVV